MPSLAQTPAWRSSTLSRVCGVRHAFFGRQGGVSNPPYDAQNVSFRVGDDEACVLENRARACAALGLAPSAWRNVHQVHGSEIRWILPSDDAQALADLPADAMASRHTKLALAIFTADCVPLLMTDSRGQGIAAVHAGWRGVAANIAQRSVASLCQQLGTISSELVVAIGPAIGPCCFEVGPEVVAKLSRALGEGVVKSGIVAPPSTKTRSERPHIDLWALNEQQLLDAGVRRENIEVIRRCTACERENFFSYRKERGRSGRQASMIALAAQT